MCSKADKKGVSSTTIISRPHWQNFRNVACAHAHPLHLHPMDYGLSIWVPNGAPGFDFFPHCFFREDKLSVPGSRKLEYCQSNCFLSQVYIKICSIFKDFFQKLAIVCSKGDKKGVPSTTIISRPDWRNFRDVACAHAHPLHCRCASHLGSAPSPVRCCTTALCHYAQKEA